MKQFAFYKQYENFVLKNPPFVQLLGMEAEGNDLYELIQSVQLTAINGLGTEINVTIAELVNEDYVRVEADVVRIFEEQKKFETKGAKVLQWAQESED